MREQILKIDWLKFLRNALLFGGPNLITAILATQTTVLPKLIDNAGYLALFIVIENLVIDLIRKFLDRNK